MKYKFLLMAESAGVEDFTRTVKASNLSDAIFVLMDDPQVSDVRYYVHPAHAAEARRSGMETCTQDEFDEVDQYADAPTRT